MSERALPKRLADRFTAQRRLLPLYLLLITFAALFPGAIAPAGAQDHRQNAVGEFDFYVLSLSWSPSFCESAGERGGPSKS